MKKSIIYTLLLILIFAFSSCKYGESTPPGDTQTQQTGVAETEPPLIHGIEVVEYPSPQSVYLYDHLTEDQKLAYDAIAEITARVIETKGQEKIEYPLPKSIHFMDESVARDLYVTNFDVQRSIVNGYITAVYDNTETVGSLAFIKGSAADSKMKMYIEVTEAAEYILASLDHDGTGYGKALAIARWMVDNIVYPYDYEERGADYLDSAYSALINKEAICDGYAKAYDFLCKKAGLETIYVTGETVASNHAWNMIRINEKWYHVDVTWMDEAGDFYGNFMMPDEVCFSNGHVSAKYYRNQETNGIIVPTADSYDLYYGFYESIVDMLESFKNKSEIEDGKTFEAILPYESIEHMASYNGSEITTTDGNTYYIRLTVDETELKHCSITFVRKLT